MIAGTAPSPATSLHALSTVLAHSTALISVALMEHEVVFAIRDLKPAVAAKATRTATNCPNGWKKKTAASIVSLYSAGAYLWRVSPNLPCSGVVNILSCQHRAEWIIRPNANTHHDPPPDQETDK